ncbi:hypothetical protein DI09_2p370 [Mitosporidium daphniae]|uniref:Uncharacterized protein n=1 Tax=Mitosporidium daphniae TaxID=1485682 RepID=A0A098VRQ5_9MICR|nr:uncharacterized protein DI09_2p370 [Mitosporidium daphniae]KGG51660.1 hypothetical protein DI09_2p370 [Mitosporidium daphniae]|eukprot:XP_013238087.1 uncharacterized protein DI09_2p370 [Mitosporidium daphniae]
MTFNLIEYICGLACNDSFDGENLYNKLAKPFYLSNTASLQPKDHPSPVSLSLSSYSSRLKARKAACAAIASLSFQDVEPLHSLWCTYVSKLFSIPPSKPNRSISTSWLTPDDLTKSSRMDLHGAYVTIKASRCAAQVGKAGNDTDSQGRNIVRMCSSNCRKGKSLYNFDFWKPNRAGQCRGKGREKVQKEINKHKQIDADGGHWGSICIFNTLCGKEYNLSSLEICNISSVVELKFLVSSDTTSCELIPPDHQILILQNGCHIKDSDLIANSQFLTVFLFDKRVLLRDQKSISNASHIEQLGTTHKHHIQIIESKFQLLLKFSSNGPRRASFDRQWHGNCNYTRFIKEKNVNASSYLETTGCNKLIIREAVLAEKILQLPSVIEESLSSFQQIIKENSAVLCDAKEQYAKAGPSMESNKIVYDDSKALLIDLVKAKNAIAILLQVEGSISSCTSIQEKLVEANGEYAAAQSLAVPSSQNDKPLNLLNTSPPNSLSITELLQIIHSLSDINETLSRENRELKGNIAHFTSNLKIVVKEYAQNLDLNMQDIEKILSKSSILNGSVGESPESSTETITPDSLLVAIESLLIRKKTMLQKGSGGPHSLNAIKSRLVDILEGRPLSPFEKGFPCTFINRL